MLGLLSRYLPLSKAQGECQLLSLGPKQQQNAIVVYLRAIPQDYKIAQAGRKHWTRSSRCLQLEDGRGIVLLERNSGSGLIVLIWQRVWNRIPSCQVGWRNLVYHCDNFVQLIEHLADSTAESWIHLYRHHSKEAWVSAHKATRSIGTLWVADVAIE